MKRSKLNKGFTLIELMIVVAIIGILAAIAIPNFIKFQVKSKQSEPKGNLKSLFTSEKAYFQEKDTYGNTAGAIGFAPERGNRYAYYLGGNGTESRAALVITGAGGGTIGVDTLKYPLLPDGATANPPTPGATQTTMPNGAAGVYQDASSLTQFSASAVGNIDNDVGAANNDEWFISSASVSAAVTACTSPTNAATNLPAVSGLPFNSLNDVSCP